MDNDYPNLTQDQLDAIAPAMHDDIRERVIDEIMDEMSPGEFLTRYMELDPGFPIHQFDTGAAS